MQTRHSLSNFESQRGFSVFLVIGLLIMTTIVTTAVYRSLNQVDRTSADGMQLQTADAAAEAGKAAAESFMQYNAGETVAMMQQFWNNQKTAASGAAIPAVQFPLDAMGTTKGQWYRVSLVDLNTDVTPMEVKLQSEGFGRDGSKKVITSIYYLKGVYKDNLNYNIGGVSWGNASGAGLTDAIWAGGFAEICGNINFGNAGGTGSSVYIGEQAMINTASCGTLQTIDITGDFVIGEGSGTSNMGGTLNIQGETSIGTIMDVGGSSSGTMRMYDKAHITKAIDVFSGSGRFESYDDLWMEGGINANGAGSFTGVFYGDTKLNVGISDFTGAVTFTADGPVDGDVWDFDGDITATGFVTLYRNGRIADHQYNMTNSGGASLVGDHNATGSATGLTSGQMTPSVESQLNPATGDKDHPFHVKAEVESAFSKTWAEWVTECGCGLSNTDIGGSEINSLVSSLVSAGKDSLFVNGAPLINANASGLNFNGGTLSVPAIIRKDDNTSGTTTLMPGTTSPGAPGGNLVILSSGDYYDFQTDGDANLLVYANGGNFEFNDPSPNTYYGNITAKEGTNLQVTGDFDFHYDQDVIDTAFKGSDGTGSIFNVGAEGSTSTSSSSSTVTTVTVGEQLRLLAPTLGVKFMGSFENQLSVVDQQAADAISLEDPQPYLDFNRAKLYIDVGLYPSFALAYAGMNIQEIYSYRGSAANCTPPTLGDYNASGFDGSVDSTFVISLTINCSGATATNELFIIVGNGSGSESSSSPANSSISGLSSGIDLSSSDGASSAGEVSSQVGVSSSAALVCDTLRTDMVGIAYQPGSDASNTVPALIGRLTRGEATYDNEVAFIPELGRVNGAITMAKLVGYFGAGQYYTSSDSVKVYEQDRLSTWNSSTVKYSDFGTTPWTTMVAGSWVGYSAGRTLVTEVGSNLTDWANRNSGLANNPGLVMTLGGNYNYTKIVEDIGLYVCTTGSIDGVGASSVAVSSSEEASSSAAVSSSVAVSSSAGSTIYTVNVQQSVEAGIDCDVSDLGDNSVTDGDYFGSSISCSSPWSMAAIDVQWKLDGTQVGTGSSYGKNITQSHNIVAYLTKKSFTINVESDPSGKISVNPSSSISVTAGDITSISLSGLSGYTLDGYVNSAGRSDGNTSTSFSVNALFNDTTITAVMKAPASDCDGSSDYNSSTDYALGIHVKESSKLYECIAYDQCQGVTPGSNGSIWSEISTCAASGVPCTAYSTGVCTWNGVNYACAGVVYTEDGTNGYTCKAAQEPRCNLNGPGDATWGPIAWEFADTCQ